MEPEVSCRKIETEATSKPINKMVFNNSKFPPEYQVLS